jgi:hypothetical protein
MSTAAAHDGRLAIATLRQRLAAIAYVHEVHHLPPHHRAGVTLTWQGLVRKHGRRPLLVTSQTDQERVRAGAAQWPPVARPRRVQGGDNPPGGRNRRPAAARTS